MIIERLELINFKEILKVFLSVSIGIILSNLIQKYKTAIIYKTKPNQALIINTGMLKNVFTSFDIKDLITDLVFIFKLPILVLLEVMTFFSLEFILKYILFNINIKATVITILIIIYNNKSLILKLVTRLAYTPGSWRNMLGSVKTKVGGRAVPGVVGALAVD
jgi:hypothetical protein